MEFRMLGSLEAEGRCGRLPLSGPGDQKVLAILLLDAEHIVPVWRLVDALWEENPPAKAVKQVQNVISRLRHILTSGGETNPIVTVPGGYRISIDGNTLDTRVFETTVAQAESAASAGDLREAVALLDKALLLWRGPALAGLSGQTIEAAAAAWDDRRCVVQEIYYDHRLALGEYRQIIGDLRTLVSAHRLRERPVAQLMLALYRCGRQAEALEVYDGARKLLAAELGLDPGPQLQRLHQQVLAGEPQLETGPPEGSAWTSTPPWLAVPRQLPAAPRRFVGRRGELRSLAELLNDQHGAMVISAVGGTAGVGKTALAVHWAHMIAERFPDGQLYVNLRGFDPAGAAVPPAEAVRGFLAALNVPAARVPANPDEQAALYRSLLAGKKILIIADNARDSAHVRPLIPGSAGCLVLVTSRGQLTGLVATDDAHMMSLGLLTDAESTQLLTARIGRERLAAEPAAAGELVSLCARLPLALSIAAAHVAAHPSRPLSVLAGLLRDTRNRLDALSADDTSVRAAFSWSYDQLHATSARTFRLLGLHPGPDISLPAAASLVGAPGDEVRPGLTELVTAHLVAEDVPGRYGFHDLLRVYAAGQVHAAETAAASDAATRRLLDHYLHTAHAAALLLHPAREPITLCPMQPGTRPERLSGQPEALAWFDAEHRVLLTVITMAADGGFARQSWQLAWTLANYLDRRGQWHAWRDTQQVVLTAARNAGDVMGQAHAVSLLGRAEVYLGRHDDAREHVTEALGLFRALNDRAACARAYLDLGWVADQQGNSASATAPMLRALAMYRSIPHEIGEAHTLSNLGWHYAILGNYQRAISCCREALTLHRAHGNVVVHAATMDTLGYIYYLLADYHSAVAHYEQAIDELGALGARVRVARTLSHLGDTHLARGDHRAARDAWQEAAAIFEEHGHPDLTGIRDKLEQLAH